MRRQVEKTLWKRMLLELLAPAVIIVLLGLTPLGKTLCKAAGYPVGEPQNNSTLYSEEGKAFFGIKEGWAWYVDRQNANGALVLICDDEYPMITNKAFCSSTSTVIY